ncbi:MAG TPA: alpha-2-macroglobulin, partial [Chitinophagaceae bacterium]|nr:alpha-2-macroglobulin [Chitinophagaceae bacterium]
NALAAYIVRQHPRIAAVLEQWKLDTTAFNSALQNNQELKQLLVEETPWVLDAENETQQKKNVALLFDMMNMKNNLQSSLNKLMQLQKDNGAFAWFKGGFDDRYITQYILTGIGRLKQLNAIPEDFSTAINDIVNNGINYLDAEISSDYKNLLKYKSNLSNNNIGSTQIQYLYMRSYFSNIIQYKTSYNYYYQQMMKYWRTQSNYMKAMIGLTLIRTNQQRYAADKIFPSLMENAVETKNRGMYWKDAQYGYYWYNAPIEQQALMIEFTSALNQSNKTVNYISEMKTWLITQKQTNHWATTKATADACFALLLRGSNWLSDEKKITIQLGSNIFTNDASQAGTGYFKQRIDGSKINNQMGNINVNVSSSTPLEPVPPKREDGGVSSSPSYGAIYWQYFENLDKITTSSSPLSLTKKLFIEKNSAQGKILQAVNDNDELHVGDKLIIRITLTSDRNMQYLHLKDMRAACMEPLNTISEYKWQDALGYYESTRDAATNFFISSIQRGTYVFEYPVYITHTGTFSAGIANIQCMYAPEFSSHSEGIKIAVGN